jgi:hypothetical protein
VKVSQATVLASAVGEVEGLELFSTPSHEPFVMIPHGTHRECWPVRSTAFRRWLARLHFAQTGTAPGSQAVTDALAVLEGRALYEGAEHEVHLRLAEHDGAVWLDLADGYWQAVKVTADKWEIVHDPPVRFRRPRGMWPLPHSKRHGSLDELHRFVNIDESEWPLFLGWLVGALRPRGPYSALLVYGEQGSAKSTLLRVARELVDPNEAPIRREPKDGQDLIVAARNGLIVSFDNVSRLAPELSDDLARLATGSGFGARQLYTDLEEVVVHVARPIALNGIEEVATRGDLLDRGLVLTLPRIGRYSDEDAFWAGFREAHPRLLGALLDAVSCALANIDKTATPNLRMADFARWVTAAEPALGLEPGAFADAYRENRAQAVQVALEASIVAPWVQKLADVGFTGTASELLKTLSTLAGETEPKKREWPNRPNVLAGQLRRLTPALRRVGVEVEFDRSSARDRTRTLSIRKLEQIDERPSRPSESSENGDRRTVADGLDADFPTCSGFAERDDLDAELERLRAKIAEPER